ncbi:2-amino-4-hydroxy-6-hydroxymethyldihydropteridine diphosphokinase [Ruegeria sp. R14_0]|uniref:2-amino-4-hydroxy-6- hydroxymethyldihydropteridine diphosphokinase n=1 Tax=Ruegeria sp. R14_0 TaxID=2821100 RepID=UPI001ADCCC4C|nr:2-amino-4-hydroxy-6-hydroxymethyldihydropteridine diphosphokinase [Ruegeria sp. R14_0]MBO9445384.1 2-amino-4-hydroxy-6-hydroxymethyldihydropteridine diphosphokinase [Ruegeria sp. R14_0]
MSNAVIALGANLKLRGNEPKVTLRDALDAISRHGVVIRAISRFYETPCFPAGAGPDYVNAAALIETEKSSEDLLEVLHQVEHEFGRERVQRWGMRTLDLDLVCFDDHILPDSAEFDRWLTLSPEEQRQRAPKQLILPHPRLQDRAFVLVPMADVAPDWRHPVLGRTVREMLADLPPEEIAAVTAA